MDDNTLFLYLMTHPKIMLLFGVGGLVGTIEWFYDATLIWHMLLLWIPLLLSCICLVIRMWYGDSGRTPMGDET